MENALIVSHLEKNGRSISEFIRAFYFLESTHVQSATAARRMLLERPFDYIIIDAPLKDESGEGLAKQIAARGTSQIILLVGSQRYESVAVMCENDGIFTIMKPLSREVFRQVFGLARSMRANQIKTMNQNDQLRHKIESIRVVDKAKHILIMLKGMSEQQAHRFIEKSAMDKRTTKFDISQRIVNDYDNGKSDN